MALEAGRIMARQIDENVKRNRSFAFETTLSGKGYIKKIKDWKTRGYEIVIYYLKLPSVEMAIERVKLRVSLGGHDVAEKDIRRRFERSWTNFEKFYRNLVHSWTIFDTSGGQPVVIEDGGAINGKI
jgi:predicted ABC-type ATPase